MLLPGTTAPQAEELARRILSGVDGLAIPHASATDGPGWVTVSIGLACDRPSPAASADSLMKRADAALYRRKRELGRHGLCIAAEAG